MSDYPIQEILPEVRAALERFSRIVVTAPTASGKTTVLPPALLDSAAGKIVMLEPRRLACVMAARRIAALLGEKPGGRVGYRTRLDSRPGSAIEVVTEGVLTRMLQRDPELAGVGMVIFDEFHERTLAADLGLALTLDVQSALRPELKLLVMSATLSAGPVAAFLGGAPVIAGRGAAFPVETLYRPGGRERPLPEMTADAVRHALEHETGSILVFLPGEGEIRRTAELLRPVSGRAEILPLYGRLDPADQERAVAPPPPGGRKVVLATNIAESSLTIEGVRVVIDSGLERRAVFNPGSGMNHLKLGRISQSAADQRRGRAGRTAPGVCYRLWSSRLQEQLPECDTPEILSSDLTPLQLECSVWGANDPRTLSWLTPPPEAMLAAARSRLTSLGAIENDGKVTEHGKYLHATGLHPAIAEIVAVGIRNDAGLTACRLAALLTEIERGLRPEIDLETALGQMGRGRAAELAGQLARRFKIEGGDRPELAGQLLARAMPERIARRRGDGLRYLLVSGRGAFFREAHPLAREEFLVIPELAGGEAESEIRLAARIDGEWLKTAFRERIADRVEVEADQGEFRWRETLSLGAVTLASRPRPAPELPEVRRAVAAWIAAEGHLNMLPWSAASTQLLERLRFLWPEEYGETALLAALEEWLLPFLTDPKQPLARIDLHSALTLRLDPVRRRELETEAPPYFTSPAGAKHPVVYAAGEPSASVKVPELYGLDRHPTLGKKHTPLRLILLSPAERPVQVTSDLPGFWRGSYALVRCEMRARYPKHFWPEEPWKEAPTLRAKPRPEKR